MTSTETPIRMSAREELMKDEASSLRGALDRTRGSSSNNVVDTPKKDSGKPPPTPGSPAQPKTGSVDLAVVPQFKLSKLTIPSMVPPSRQESPRGPDTPPSSSSSAPGTPKTIRRVISSNNLQAQPKQPGDSETAPAPTAVPVNDTTSSAPPTPEVSALVKSTDPVEPPEPPASATSPKPVNKIPNKVVSSKKADDVPQPISAPVVSDTPKAASSDPSLDPKPEVVDPDSADSSEYSPMASTPVPPTVTSASPLSSKDVPVVEVAPPSESPVGSTVAVVPPPMSTNAVSEEVKVSPKSSPEPVEEILSPAVAAVETPSPVFAKTTSTTYRDPLNNTTTTSSTTFKQQAYKQTSTTQQITRSSSVQVKKTSIVVTAASVSGTTATTNATVAAFAASLARSGPSNSTPKIEDISNTSPKVTFPVSPRGSSSPKDSPNSKPLATKNSEYSLSSAVTPVASAHQQTSANTSVSTQPNNPTQRTTSTSSTESSPSSKQSAYSQRSVSRLASLGLGRLSLVEIPSVLPVLSPESSDVKNKKNEPVASSPHSSRSLSTASSQSSQSLRNMEAAANNKGTTPNTPSSFAISSVVSTPFPSNQVTPSVTPVPTPTGAVYSNGKPLIPPLPIADTSPLRSASNDLRSASNDDSKTSTDELQDAVKRGERRAEASVPDRVPSRTNSVDANLTLDADDDEISEDEGDGYQMHGAYLFPRAHVHDHSNDDINHDGHGHGHSHHKPSSNHGHEHPPAPVISPVRSHQSLLSPLTPPQGLNSNGATSTTPVAVPISISSMDQHNLNHSMTTIINQTNVSIVVPPPRDTPQQVASNTRDVPAPMLQSRSTSSSKVIVPIRVNATSPPLTSPPPSASAAVSNSPQRSVSSDSTSSPSIVRVTTDNMNQTLLPFTTSASHYPPPPPPYLQDMQSYGFQKYVPYSLSDDEVMKLTLLISEQESKYGQNMFDGLNRREKDEVDRLVKDFGLAYEDASLIVFEKKHTGVVATAFPIFPHRQVNKPSQNNRPLSRIGSRDVINPPVVPAPQMISAPAASLAPVPAPTPPAPVPLPVLTRLPSNNSMSSLVFPQNAPAVPVATAPIPAVLIPIKYVVPTPQPQAQPQIQPLDVHIHTLQSQPQSQPQPQQQAPAPQQQPTSILYCIQPNPNPVLQPIGTTSVVCLPPPSQTTAPEQRQSPPQQEPPQQPQPQSQQLVQAPQQQTVAIPLNRLVAIPIKPVTPVTALQVQNNSSDPRVLHVANRPVAVTIPAQNHFGDPSSRSLAAGATSPSSVVHVFQQSPVKPIASAQSRPIFYAAYFHPQQKQPVQQQLQPQPVVNDGQVKNLVSLYENMGRKAYPAGRADNFIGAQSQDYHSLPRTYSDIPVSTQERSMVPLRAASESFRVDRRALSSYM